MGFSKNQDIEYFQILKSFYRIPDKLIELSEIAEKNLINQFQNIEKKAKYNQLKVIKAFHEAGIKEHHLMGSSGYGYFDQGREMLDKVFASVFGGEEAIVRSQIVSGTHAIACGFFGILRPGDELLVLSTSPYETLKNIFGVDGKTEGSLKDWGINTLFCHPRNTSQIKSLITPATRMAFLQRSGGYQWQTSLSLEEIAQISKFIKGLNEEIIIFVDNCYGEFVDTREPLEFGADIIAGSLIKNPGGGLAHTGGYLVTKKEYIKKISTRITCPGLGKEVGATMGNNRSFFQGIFLAPQIVAESLKGMVFASWFYKNLGLEVHPQPEDDRNDIVQAIRVKSKEEIIAFCKGIQTAGVIDSTATPVMEELAGYKEKIIMAAGTFIQGSSIELSADAPLREPYTIYLQGGLNYTHAKLGVLLAAKELLQTRTYKLY